MDTKFIEQVILRNAGSSDRSKGEMSYKKGLAKIIDEKVIDKEELQIYGAVKHEYRQEIYKTEIVLNIRHKCAIEACCECFEFYSNYFSHEIYFCNHIIATLYQYMRESRVRKENDNKFIIEAYKSISKEMINLEVILGGSLNDNELTYSLEFRVGINKLYVVKDIKEFLRCYKNKEELRYGNEFTFDIKKQEFGKVDEKIIAFMENINAIDECYGSQYGSYKIINGKKVNLPKDMLRSFLEQARDKEIRLSFITTLGNTIDKQVQEINHDGRVIYGKMPLNFNICKNEKGISLVQTNELPIPLNKKEDVFLYGINIYVPPKEQIIKYKPIHNKLKESKRIGFSNEEKEIALNTIIPVLSKISSDVKVHKDISMKMVKEHLKVKFYLDKNKGEITLMLKLVYGDEEGDYFSFCGKNNIIIRDYEEEEKILLTLKELKFVIKDNKFIYKGNDSDLFYFVQEGIEKLTEIGEVYYSERFKNNKIYSYKSVRGDIKDGGNGYLEFDFKIDDMPYDEINKIMEAVKDNRKFYKLKSGSFVDLRENGMQDFLRVIENLSDSKIKGNLLRLHKSKAIYLNEVLQEKNLTFIKGQQLVKDISSKIGNINNLDLTLSNDLKVELRGYQKIGYNWLKTLAYYGFGGILADEMGLGKTIQIISFLASEKGKKSLIVAPTSLIYNWQSEFDKFNPNASVLLIHGTKGERDELLNKINDYDIIITTYNLLRIDLESYKERKFDYFIIDEAQNIKNPLAQSTEAVKEINAGVRFALTGTPIENSLIELWSIFDFIMPGYLFNRQLFQERFIKNGNDEERVRELNRFIKPFILRRCKKEVIKELPDKIEKKLLVDMTEEQKKVYATYVAGIKENIEKHIQDGEFKRKQIEILSYITKLRQICLEPSIIMHDYAHGSGKTEALIETLTQSIEEGHKVLIFSQFTSALKIISERLKKSDIEHFYLDGKTKADERLRLVENFNNGDKQVFLISLKAGGTGLNLTSADIVIHFDPWWNSAVEDQATDRAHRIGQKNVVEVIKLIAKGTIEEKILKLQETKREIVESVMNGNLNDGNVIRNLSESDLMELFK